MKCRVVAVLGTRPEAIKLALVIHELRRRSDEFETAVVHTGQHRTMLDHALQFFQIKPDFDLDVMRPNQTLNSLTGRVLDTVENACRRFEPNLVLVQGDTTTAFASAVAAYYCKVPIGHIEAGLRSHDIYNPFPEEGNRRLISVLSRVHFAPTALSRDKLLAEGVPNEHVVVTGNTVVDTLRALSHVPETWEGTPLADIPVDNRRLILVTSHRRESWGADQENMCLALKELVAKHDDVRIVYPVHMNPNVRNTVSTLLNDSERIHLTEPLDYITFVGLLKRCFLVLTDSGGIQEEAPTFRKPVLVLRRLTERPEASQFGMAKIIGMSRESIVSETSALLTNSDAYSDMSVGENPYGDGKASQRIVEAAARWFHGKTPLLDATQEFKVPPRRYPRRRKTDFAQDAKVATAAAGKD
ncbi:MAG TPA: UDP-N-acetylglucosamine 2-epimerase (non-hydrolyzing) [Terriglobales bacterium]|nr:UDP-N-acetylglucosamine 2-epimerase (non-hydrolyzing) [Terriglobales bacterium]